MVSLYSWISEQKSSALVGSKEVALGICLVLQDHAIDFDGLFRFGRIGKAADDEALIDCQRQFVCVESVGQNERILRRQGELVGDRREQISAGENDLPAGQGQ